MLMFILRAMFLLSLGAVGMGFAAKSSEGSGLLSGELVMAACLILALIVIAVDTFIPQKSLVQHLPDDFVLRMLDQGAIHVKANQIHAALSLIRTHEARASRASIKAQRVLASVISPA